MAKLMKSMEFPVDEKGRPVKVDTEATTVEQALKQMANAAAHLTTYTMAL